MSLHPRPIAPIPVATARVARAAFPKGTVAMRIRDEVGVIYQDEQFTSLFPARGRTAAAPWRLMLVTLLQFAEDLTDRQAAEAVRSRIDWKYALALSLEDAGFDASVLCEFRTRLLQEGTERRLFDTLLDHLKTAGLLNARGRQRTDSTHVLAAVRALTRLEVVGETLRQALNCLAVVAPAWLQAQLQPTWDEWVERYGQRFTDYRLPRAEPAQVALAEAIGVDGRRLLSAIYDPASPPWLREVPAVETLRQVWVQQYHAIPAGPAGAVGHASQDDPPPGTPRWRGDRDLPPASQFIQSPYDSDARFTTKRAIRWTGYKAHVTETCEPDEPHLIVHIETTEATTHDSKVTPEIHRALAARALLPTQHLADQGYVDSELLLASQEAFGVTLLGPVPADQSWQALAAEGFAITDFAIDWDTSTVRCPQGKQSTGWCPAIDQYGDPVIHVNFGRTECAVCPSRAHCTRSTTTGRKLTVRPRPKHEALVAARHRQTTAAFGVEYARRAGIEGTLAQGTRRFGLRHARYRGLPKTRLQHVLTALSMNLVRLVAWFGDPTHSRVQPSHFVALAATV